MSDAARVAALIHSPLTTAAAWGELPDALRALGWSVTVTEVLDDNAPPYASRFIARTAHQLLLEQPQAHLHLIGHGEAGPLLPQIAFARQSLGVPVSSYLFVDSLLPRTLRAGNLLDLMEAQDPVGSAQLAQLLADGGRFPDWSERELSSDVRNARDRAVLLASLRPRSLDFFTETLPIPEDWPDAPCRYLQTSEAYEPEARTAELRGWSVQRVAAHHFWALTHPQAAAAAIAAMLDR